MQLKACISKEFHRFGGCVPVHQRRRISLIGHRSASVYRNDTRQQIFDAEDELTVPDVLPGFAVIVGKLFE